MAITSAALRVGITVVGLLCLSGVGEGAPATKRFDSAIRPETHAMPASHLGVASSHSPDRFVAGLEEAGYVVTVDLAAVPHPSLKVQGVAMTADKFGAVAELELLAYESQQAMTEDWIVIDGSAPVPRVPVPELNGKSLYWREETILVVDYARSTDAGTAWIAALVFVGHRGTSPHGLRIGIVPPGTGDAGLAENH